MSAVGMLGARLARIAPGGVRMLVVTDYTAGSSPWIDGLIRRLLTDDMPRCGHLTRGPKPGYLYVAEGFGRCLACHLQAAPTEPERAGGAACGRCGTTAGAGRRKAVAVQVGAWAMLSAVCPVCELLLLHERDQAAAAASAGR